MGSGWGREGRAKGRKVDDGETERKTAEGLGVTGRRKD
jgi:hypothetical protein